MMKTNKKPLYIVIVFVCILAVSVVIVKNKNSTSLAPADNKSSSSSSEVGSSTTESTTIFSFEYEEMVKASEESVTEGKVTEVHTATKPTTTTTTKVTTTTRKDTTATTTKPSKVHSTTEPQTETTTKKILYYYTDGTTGYTPKPGAEYYSNGCWQIVSWGNSVSDEEIKEAHKYCKYCGREDCIRFWISEQECPDCGVLVPIDVCHHCSL